MGFKLNKLDKDKVFLLPNFSFNFTVSTMKISTVQGLKDWPVL